MLATDHRRSQVAEWAAGFVEAMRPRFPQLTEAVAEAAAAMAETRPTADPVWLGAVRGVLLEYQARVLARGQGPLAASLS